MTLRRRSTRRSFLRWTAGATGLALGCDAPRQPGGFDLDLGGITGSIVGASHEVGHRLRQDLSALKNSTPAEVRDVSVVIAGAGMAGLSAGWKLLGGGFDDFAMLELEDVAGGNARWGQNEVSAYPWGAHYLPVPTPESVAVRELVREMGLVVDENADGEPIYDPRHLCHAPQERIFVGGGWRHDAISARDLVDDPAEAAALHAFESQVRAWRDFRDADGRRAFALPMELSSTAPEIRQLDQMSMREDFDLRGWNSERLRWYVNYCCRDDYGCELDATSAWAGWHYFCARPKNLEYLTWPEGNGRIVRHLVDKIGQRSHTGMLVYSVRPQNAGQNADDPEAGVIVDALDVQNETTVRFRARRVIYALPRFTAPWVIEGYPRRDAQSFTYSPWLVANLTVRRPPEGAAWDNVIYNSPSLGYVVATHQDLKMSRGPSVLTYYLPLSGFDPGAERQALLERGWSDWVTFILADLSEAHPEIETLITHVDIMLWGHAMVRPTPGFVWSAERKRAAEPFGAVSFAHSDMSGLSLFEEAQYRGIRAAEDLLRDFDRDFTSSLEI